MNNDIYSMDLLQFLPGALKHDEKMVALARGLADELLGVSGHIRDVLIYSRIDELPEELVDILAYDMHVDWYDYGYPVEAKRNILRDSVKVHKKMGTKYAIEKALGGIYPYSEVEEWFDYEGEPHHFQVICDVTNQHITASYQQIVRAIKMYKRLSSWLDGVVYQSSIKVDVGTHTDFFIYNTPVAGRIKAGTYPYRNVRAGIARETVIVGTERAGFIFASPQTGTVPQRNIVFNQGAAHVDVETALDMMGYSSPQAGQIKAGEHPQRNRRARMADSAEELNAMTENKVYQATQAGTAPKRAIKSGMDDKRVDALLKTDAQKYDSPQTGTVPQRNTLEQTDSNTVGNAAEMAVFHYKIKPCGSKRRI